MNYRLKVGDAAVTCEDHHAERADRRDRSAARRFPPTCAETPEEVDAFCASLSGVPSLDYTIARAVLPASPLPRGFEHFRLFTPQDDEPFHRTFKVEETTARLTSRSVLYAVLCSPCSEVTAWTSTIRRAMAIPGVLDLEVDIVMREAFRPLLIRE